MILQDYILDSLGLEPKIFIVDDNFSYKGEQPLNSIDIEFNRFPGYERVEPREENIYEIDAAVSEWRDKFPFKFSVELCKSSNEFIDKFKSANQFAFCIFDLRLESSDYQDGLNLIEFAINLNKDLNFVILSASTYKKKDIIKKYDIPSKFFFKKEADIDKNFREIGEVILSTFPKVVNDQLSFVKIDSCWDTKGNRSIDSSVIIEKLASNDEITMSEWVYALKNILNTTNERSYIYTKSFTILLKQFTYDQFLSDSNNLIYCKYESGNAIWIFDPLYENGIIKIELTNITSIQSSLSLLRNQIQLVNDFYRKLLIQFFIDRFIEMFIDNSFSANSIKTYLDEIEDIVNQGYLIPLYPHKKFHFINQLWQNLTLITTDTSLTDKKIGDFITLGFPEIENVFFGRFISDQTNVEIQTNPSEEIMVELKGISSIDFTFVALLSRKRVSRSNLAASKFDCFRMVIHFYNELDQPYLEPLNPTLFER